MPLSRRPILVTLALVCTALLFGLSMPLPWHHRMPDTGGIVVVRGIDGASWLLAAVLVALIVLVQHLRDRAGFYVKWLLTVSSLLLLIGIFTDYIDWQNRAAQKQGLNYVPAYFGPGFYLALAGTATFLVSMVLLWRVE